MKPPTSPTPSHANSYSTYGGASPLPTPANSSRSCLSATTKSYKYLRRLLKFDQMDFEFALWQMLYLFVSPQKVYRNFNYRKRKCASTDSNNISSMGKSFLMFTETKSQFARDDPAFLVLLSVCLCGKF